MRAMTRKMRMLRLRFWKEVREELVFWVCNNEKVIDLDFESTAHRIFVAYVLELLLWRQRIVSCVA